MALEYRGRTPVEYGPWGGGAQWASRGGAGRRGTPKRSNVDRSLELIRGKPYVDQRGGERFVEVLFGHSCVDRASRFVEPLDVLSQ